MRFLFIFYTSFVVVSFLIYLSFDRTNEILASMLWFEGWYMLFGIPTWLLINKIIVSTSFSKLMLRFLAGLILLNMLSLMLNGTFPVVGLITIGKYHWDFWISLSLHVVYTLSYVLATKFEKRSMSK